VLRTVPEAIRRDVYAERDSERKSLLADLKRRIRDSGCPVMEGYPARWDPEAYDRSSRSVGRFVGLEAFARRVQEQLWAAIREELQLPEQPPAGPTTDAECEEQDHHERFLESRQRVYVGWEEIHDALLKFAEGDGGVPCLVTGRPGAGKSASLAWFVRAYRRRHAAALVIPHFVGASPRSTNLRDVLRRFCRALKGGPMGLRDYFRPAKPPLQMPPGDYWGNICRLCLDFIGGAINDFKGQGHPLADWAEPRYRKLAAPEALGRLAREARQLLVESQGQGVLLPGPLFRWDSWVVSLSVLPTDEAGLVAACPGGSFEQLAFRSRSLFREQVKRWEEYDFAHWVLLLDEPRGRALVAALTLWSHQQTLAWIEKPSEGGPAMLSPAPYIVPGELLAAGAVQFLDEMIREDARWALQNAHPSPRAQDQAGHAPDPEPSGVAPFGAGHSIVKVLLMDSVTAEHPVPSRNPLDFTSTADPQVGNLLDQVCRGHAQDCRGTTSPLIPLVIGVPAAHLKPCQTHPAAKGYHGLVDRRVWCIPEAEGSLVSMSGAAFTPLPGSPRYLSRGGHTLLHSFATPLWSFFWALGVRWVLFGQVWNRGCRIDLDWVRALHRCRGDGFFECVDRTAAPDSKLLVAHLEGNRPRHVCLDDHRLRTPQHGGFRKSAAVAGTGTFWVRLESLISSLGLDPRRILVNFDASYARKACAEIAHDPIVTVHPAGGVATTFPVWELFSNLDLAPVQVPPWRYQPRPDSTTSSRERP
jgi:hypothetical protein